MNLKMWITNLARNFLSVYMYACHTYMPKNSLSKQTTEESCYSKNVAECVSYYIKTNSFLFLS